MKKLDLTKYGITGTTEIVYNPSFEELFAEETKPGLEGYEKGQVSELGAVNVMTGIYTGRSPKDKFIVMDETSKDTVWWTSEGYKNDNHPAVSYTHLALRHFADAAVVHSLDHDADERLRAGDARHDAALLAQFALGFVDGVLDFGVCVKRCV